MTLSAKVVDFVGFDREHQARETRAVGQIAVMENKFGIGRVSVLIDMFPGGRC